MPRINLLPWRDEERKERKLEFLVALGRRSGRRRRWSRSAVAHHVMDSMIDAQDARNERLQGRDRRARQADRGDQQPREPTKQRFIARMEVIEKLQRSRPEIVHVFDEIVEQLPDGVYLTA